MKRRAFKRCIAVIVSAQMLVSGMWTTAFALDSGDRFEKDGITYTVLTEASDGAAGTVQAGNGWSSMNISKSTVIIPETVTDTDGSSYTVVSIGKKAFDNISGECSVNNITIPATVTSIGDGAFSDLTSLSSVTFVEGSGLLSIGDNAFDSTSISSIELPDTVTTIGESAFTKCRYLSAIDLPEALTSLGDSAFSGDSYLSQVNIGKSLNSLGANVFDGCTKLSSINAASGNSSYTSEDGILFNSDKTALLAYPAGKTDVEYDAPSSVVSVGDYAFANNQKLEKVTLPNGVETLGKYAFSKAAKLQTLEVGNSLKSIGTLAFWNCSKLQSLTIPDSVTEIGSDAFYDCYDTKFYVYSENVKQLVKNAGVSEDNIEIIDPPADPVFTVDGITYKITADAADGSAGEVQIGDGENAMTGLSGQITVPSEVRSAGNTYKVTAVAYKAFMDSRITGITLPETVKTIGDHAFHGSSLTSFVMPESITEIGAYSFSGTASLPSVTVSSKLAKISANAFSSSGLTSLKLPEGVTEIGEYAFNQCANLQKVELPASLTSIGKQAFWSNEALRSVTIADGSKLENINNIAFQFCNTLKSINLPAGLKTIGESAFANCTSLTDIGLGIDSKLEDLGATAFNATEITSFYFPASLKNIGDKPLASCAKLTELTAAADNKFYSSTDGVLFSKDGTILVQYPANRKASEYTTPDGVTEIGPYAFQGTSSRLKEINIGSGVKTVKAFAFQASEAESINIADSVTSMERLCFYNCPYLESIKLSSAMTTFTENLIYNCASLKKLDIPESVKNIEAGAVSNCQNLSSINIAAADLETVGSNAFSSLSSALKITVTSEEAKAKVVESGISEDQVSVRKAEPSTPAGSSFVYEGITYKVQTAAANGANGTVQLGDGVNCITASGSVTIPSTVRNGENTYDVVSVGSNALKNSNVTEFRLPDSVKTLQDSALYGANKLTAFEIPAGVESIGMNAIAGCAKLRSITYKEGSSLKTLGNGALSDNTVLETIALPNTLEDLGTYAMFYNYALREVTFQEGSKWTTLPDGTFMRDVSLKKVNLPASVSTIGTQAFWNCEALDNIDISDVSEIGAQAFYNCTSLSSVKLGDKLTKLESGTFENCSGLKTVTLGKGMKVIGDMRQTGEEDLTGAFEGCTALESIVLPDSVEEIGKNTFKGCSALKSIEMKSEAIKAVGANAFYDLADDFVITVKNEDVKNTLMTSAFVEEPHIKIDENIKPAEAAVTLKSKGAGGIGMLAQAEAANAPDGCWFLVQVTNTAGVNSVYAVPVPASGTLDISYSTGNHVTVWLTERQPEMTAQTPNAGGRVYGSASL